MQRRRAAQIEIVAFEFLRGLVPRPLELGLLEPRRDQADDAGRDLVLQAEYILELAFEPVRPDMGAARGLDQLTGNADPVAGPADAALEHIAHAEFAADLLDVDGFALVGEGRIARDDEQRLEPRQRGDDLLDHAVGEIFLLGIAAHVLERQYRDRRHVGRRHRAIGLASAGPPSRAPTPLPHRSGFAMPASARRCSSGSARRGRRTRR